MSETTPKKKSLTSLVIHVYRSHVDGACYVVTDAEMKGLFGIKDPEKLDGGDYLYTTALPAPVADEPIESVSALYAVSTENHNVNLQAIHSSNYVALKAFPAFAEMLKDLNHDYGQAAAEVNAVLNALEDGPH
jgi:hypothetical protein